MKNSKGALILFLLLLLGGSALLAQIPVIQKVELLNTYPQNKILVTGTGFSATPANLQVWFDQVKGTVTSSSSGSIEVTVPVQAVLNNVEVINLSSKLSAKSALKFMPSFSGEPFDASKFAAPVSFTSTTEVWDLCSCDFNSDSKPDLITSKFGAGSNNVMILQNASTPGTLSFSKIDLPTSFPTDNAVCGDLNGDGKPDLVLSRAGSPRNSIHIFRNTSAAGISFVTPVNLFLETGHFATRMKIFDLNGDGKPEIIVTNSFNNTLYVFQNTSTGGTLSFNATPIKITVTGAATVYGVEVQDFNADGAPDIALTPFQTNDIFLLRNSSTSSISFSEPQKITLEGTLNAINSADFNKDGKLDLVVTSTTSIYNKAHVLLNTSSGSTFSFNILPALSTTNGPWGVDVSDIDGDSDPDFIIANRDQAVLNVFLHSGNFASPAFNKVDITTSKNARNVRVSDFDSDGKPDLAVTTFNTATFNFSTDILRNKNCHQPVILNEAPLSICAGQTIRLKAIPAVNVTYTWKKDGTDVQTGPNAYYDATAAGSYTVVATGEGGSCALTSTALVISSAAGTVPSDPAITAPDAVCTGSAIALSTPAVTGATYTWTGPNGFTSTSRTPSVPSATFDAAGFYNVQVAVGSCKSNLVSKRIDVVDLDEVSISSTVASNTLCQGNSLTLSVGNDPGLTFQWLKEGSDIVGQTTSSLTVTAAGSYQVRIDNSAVSCSTTTDAVTVKILTAPISLFTVKPDACVGEQITFTNQSQVDLNSTPVYTWAFGDGNTSTINSPDHSYLIAQSYSPSLIVSYNGVAGCSNSSTKPVAIKAAIAPNITASATEICPEEQVNLSVAGTYTSITWSTGETGSSITINTAGEYTVQTLDATGCQGNDNVNITAKFVPTISVTASSNSVEAGGSVQLEAFGANSYVWEPSESLNNATIPNPVATPVNNTTYVVTGTVTGGCSGEASIAITIQSEQNINIKPLPAFSPNGDGSNEVWIIEGIENYPGCVLSVFDGRGRRVYEKMGYSSDWDGTYQGKPVPDGTYYYVFGCDGVKPSTGSVLIFR